MSSQGALERVHAAYAEHRWIDVLEQYANATQEDAISAQDLERLSTAAFLVGRNSDGVDLLARAPDEYLRVDDPIQAARCAGWIGIHLMGAHEMARSAGWFARSQRLIEREGDEAGAGQGFAIVPVAIGALFSGDAETALRAFEEIAVTAERFYSLSVFSLPIGPIWVLHGFYLVASALMLAMFLRYRAHASVASRMRPTRRLDTDRGDALSARASTRGSADEAHHVLDPRVVLEPVH